MFRVTVYHATIANHVLLYSLQPLCRLDYVKKFVQQKFWDSPECKISSPRIHSFINKTEIKRPKKVELEDRRNVSKIRTKSFGFTNVNVNNLNSLSISSKDSFPVLFVCTLFTVFTYFLCCLACGILVSQPVTEPGPSRGKVQAPHRWAAASFCISQWF